MENKAKEAFSEHQLEKRGSNKTTALRRFIDTESKPGDFKKTLGLRQGLIALLSFL
ncbi:hypothetical protein FC82_GL000536 [Secundilactobacillus collinoides DSM 20515 = JCM 1123]|uniref:Uncharacterized protein n=1 Tax=Secundilactobacillus collinoides DSM 20515 = JCM 1123 TaxID=1423733 RepID=A0A0R2BMN9_SECCO|nr:hypothetical protein FC82_GL000536 [Secundilactobacillus collinoides DSM 20515 = JCM 1123]